MKFIVKHQEKRKIIGNKIDYSLKKLYLFYSDELKNILAQFQTNFTYLF